MKLSANNTVKYLALLSFCFLKMSCSESKQADGEFVPFDTTTMTFVAPEVIVALNTPSVSQIIDYGDLLLVWGYFDRKNFALVDKNGTVVKCFSTVGRGAGEVLQINNIHKVGERGLSVYDGRGQSLLYFDIDSVLKGNMLPLKVERIDMLDGFTAIKSIYDLGEGERICFGYQNNMPLGRQNRMAKTTGDTVTYYANYPQYENPMLMQSAYSEQLVDFANQQMIVANKGFGATIEFFDVNEQVSLKNTRYILEPEVVLDDHGNVDYVKSQNAQLGFAGLSVGGDRLFFLYSGQQLSKYNAKQKIVVVDRVSGTIENIYNTNERLMSVEYSDVDHLLYAISLDESGEWLLLKYKI